MEYDNYLLNVYCYQFSILKISILSKMYIFNEDIECKLVLKYLLYNSYNLDIFIFKVNF